MPDCKYFTTPIFYVNDSPHIGHAYTMLIVDLLSRYNKFFDKDVYFLTGTDEHGLKIQQSALKKEIEPIELVTKYSKNFEKLWEKLNYTYDDFIRTTEDRHISVVQTILQTLYEKGDIYLGTYEGFYCIPCEMFLLEKDLKEDKCPHCNREVSQFEEKNYFFRMSKYSNWLKEYIKENDFIQPKFRANEALGFIGDGLNDLCISRSKSRLSWGIDLPFDNKYVTYVWFDALINYISALGYPSDKFEEMWPPSVQVIGKDILITHTVYWMTMLKALNLPMPEKIYAHGWWLVDKNKMSKSVGNVVDPIEISDAYGVDALRYFLVAEMTPGNDTSFSLESFVQRYNNDLANDLGNTLNRVSAMIHKYRNGILEKPTSSDNKNNPIPFILDEANKIPLYVDELAVNKITNLSGKLLHIVNKYINESEPWKISKVDDSYNYNLLNEILYNCVESIRIISGILYPIMPNKIKELRCVINYSDDLQLFDSVVKMNVIADGHEIGNNIIVFPRIE